MRTGAEGAGSAPGPRDRDDSEGPGGDHYGPAEDYPDRLLADYVAVSRRRPRRALAASIMRTRSLTARRLLAHAATDGSASLPELLAAARREGAGPALRSEHLDAEAMTDLTRVLAVQAILPRDREDAYALCELALELLGAEAVPPPQQGLHAQLACSLGRPARAAELLTAYAGISDIVRSTLAIDLCRPFDSLVASTREWLERLGGLLPGCRLALGDDPNRSPFDRLRASASQEAPGPQLISVIVTCFRPDEGLETALRSLVDQSWRNLEIVLVDDGSPAAFDPLLRRCAALDARIRLLRLDDNRGTYTARNIGLEAATGELVTFQDSDDWSHPLRLEQGMARLQEDPGLVAVASDLLRTTSELTFTHPGRALVFEARQSLMFRKEPVLQRVGYMHAIRKAADTEYRRRIEAAFGSDAVCRLRRTIHILKRERESSLSEPDFRGGSVHPARPAYWSAYAEWHRQIRAGEASPYVPNDAVADPVPAPAALKLSARHPAGNSYDVVLACDWRPLGGPQKSMLEEIHALTRRGLRVGVLHLEAYRFMTTKHKPLCRPVQRLINDGVVDQVLMSEEHEVSLLVLRYPPILQFPPHEPSRLRAERLTILANQAPSELDGSDLRYLPEACTRAARDLFGVHPLWAPQGPQARAALVDAGLSSADLAAFDMPGVIDTEAWCRERTGFRSTIPVLGRHSRDNWTKWPGERDALLAAYPDSTDVDLRLMGGSTTPSEVLGGCNLPANWLSFDYDELEVEAFLAQLDFWVYFPHERASEAFGRAMLEALASGCVVILPHRFAETFEDAALYREPAEVRETIHDYHRDPDGFLEQSALGQERVRRRFSHGAHFERVSSLLDEGADPRQGERGDARGPQASTHA